MTNSNSNSNLKVIHIGTGNTGERALRYLISHPLLELVGLHTYSASKQGQDAGILCGMPETGILGVSNIKELAALKADCVLYMSTEWGREVQDVIQEMCLFLAAGKNVVTTTLPPLIYPAGLGADIQKMLQSACNKGNSAFCCTGIEPGYTADVLPLTLSGLCEKIDKIHIHEHLNVGAYPEEQQAEMFGFGKSLKEANATAPVGIWKMYWSGTMGVLAEGLHLDIDEVEEFSDWAVADKGYDFGWMSIKEGEVGAAYFEVRAKVRGEIKVLVSHCYSLHDDISAKWLNSCPPGNEQYRNTSIRISGTPDINLELGIDDKHRPISGSTATAARAVNSIIPLCKSGSGVKTFLDLPPVLGACTFQ